MCVAASGECAGDSANVNYLILLINNNSMLTLPLEAILLNDSSVSYCNSRLSTPDA